MAFKSVIVLLFMRHISMEEERLDDKTLAFMQSTVDSNKDNRVNSGSSDWTTCAPSWYLQYYIYCYLFLSYDNCTHKMYNISAY